jgi:hypothetical protein
MQDVIFLKEGTLTLSGKFVSSPTAGIELTLSNEVHIY